MQISVDVNEPFTIKCYATTQTKALLYIKLLMINTLFVEQISPQINFFTKNIQHCSSLWRRLSRSSFTDMQIWDEPWGFLTLPYHDTQGITQPRTQASLRYPSYQRRLGTKCDSARRPLQIFPTSLTGDVTSEITEDDWERESV